VKYLLDTNVISELFKKKPNKMVIDWFEEVPSDSLYISCITVGELKAGAIKKLSRDKVAGEVLFKWIYQLVSEYDDQIIDIDLKVCESWAELLSVDSTNAIDSLIASQAICENAILVTRNIKHFKMFNLKMINPFDDM
jgi:toxin FitB